MSQLRWLLPVVAAFFLVVPSTGEIYRCTGADGELLFTGDAAQCPGQMPHESKGQLQNFATRPVLEAPPSRTAAALPPRDDPVAEEAEAARWRVRKRGAESRLQKTDSRLPSLRKAVGWCNRGNSVYSRDDLSIRRNLSCDKLKAQYEELANQAEELRSYLDGGLEEECRRAGCLPGWVR